LGRGQQPPPHQLGSAWSPDPPKGIPVQYFQQALRMTSPDTMILLTVDYHAAIGGQDPRAPLRTQL